MTLPPTNAAAHEESRAGTFGRTRSMVALILLVLLILCFVFVFTTRDVMRNLPSVSRGGKTPAADRSNIVDLSPWSTAEALAPLAVTAEETDYARQAERLADHEVDQAFAAALRKATIQAQHRILAGPALALSQRVQQLQQMVEQDQEQVKRLSAGAPASNATAPAGETDLEIAKAQLGLESDELADATEDLNRLTGDQRAQIQSELAAHEAQMKKYDQAHEDGQVAVLSAQRYGTLAGRIRAFNRQDARAKLLDQAANEAQDTVRSLTAEHNVLEAAADASPQGTAGAGQDRNARLASIKDRSAQRQLLSIYDDRIQTEQQLATVYQRWATQVRLQHRILLHLMVQSVAWIIVVLIAMVLGDGLVRRLMQYPVLDERQRRTLRAILELGIQIVGIVLILLVIFGAPQQTTTFIGLATAALTIALQDFVLAFFGWFVLMGKKGIRVGDLVEINGVGGEVIEIGLISTTLLETGSLAEKGYPTGRRITFMNSFAIRGQYFNFSTAGQWMWDQITVAIPASVDTLATVDRILEAVQSETRENNRLAEQEWRRALRGEDLQRFHAVPAVSLRPSGSGWDIDVRYVSRASQRFELRNHLYQRVVDLLREQVAPASA